MNESKQQPISEERLRILIQSGDDCIDVAQGLIEKHKLPYVILKRDVVISICHSEEFANGVCPKCDRGPEGNSKTITKYTLRSSFSDGELFLNKFITVDQETIEMKAEALKISKTPYEVLIFGETGTGKDLIASSQIDNRKGQLKVVNCSGFPRDLIESELFGHVRGAFTGATSEKEGLISSACDGVMFLDEIGDLPIEVQAKLLRTLQYKLIRKVGSNKEEPVNCKFVCATNKDLRKMVKIGSFREDLFARLSTLELYIKPLRDRICDLVPITQSLKGGQEFLAKYQDDLLKGLFDLSLNVRSLQQYVIRYSVLGRVSTHKRD